MTSCNERYGLPGKVIRNLHSRWKKSIEKDTEWENFDAFVSWSIVSGYGKGKLLRKYNDFAPHGPGNSFWFSRGEDLEKKKQKIAELRKITCRFCQECERTCPGNGEGCQAWRDWFVLTWDKEIHKTVSESLLTPKQREREYFQYEHPDLVREGIVIESSGSM